MHLADVPLISGAAPLIGHARTFQSKRLQFLERATLEQPDAGRMRLFGTEPLYTTSPAVVHDAFVEKARSFEKAPVVRAVLYPLAGDGLFTSDGELWRRQRRLMAPIFTPAVIDRYVSVVTQVVARAAQRYNDGASVDVGREMTRITMAIVGKALFDADAFDEADALGDALTAALGWSNEHLGSTQLALQMLLRSGLEGAESRWPSFADSRRTGLVRRLGLPLVLPGRRGRDLREAVGLLDRRIARMISDRRAGGLEGDDLLTRLLRARDDDGSQMDDRQVRDEAFTLFAAGHETTATALTWAFYLLARNPEAQAKLSREADARGDDTSFGDPSRFAYAIKVFKEAMRLYPPIYFLMRRATEPVTVGGYQLPRHALVFVSPYTIHRRPDIYPDPESFDPERFDPKAEALRPRSAYLPFGAGPRTCIGNHFAMMEAPIVISALARALHFEMPSGASVVPSTFATLRPATPVLATVRRRGQHGPTHA